MARPTVEPTKHNDRHGEETLRHPAFGQISLSRQSGGFNLYGSNFSHQNVIALRIHESELRRGTARDWSYQRGEIIEVLMTEHQFGTFVTSVGMGSGVQCTINSRNRTLVPGLPDQNRLSEFNREGQEALDGVIENLKGLYAKVDELSAGLSKARKAELLALVNDSIRKMSDTFPFIRDMFAEHLEDEGERLKAAINAYALSLSQNSGQGQLEGRQGPSQIEDQSGERE